MAWGPEQDAGTKEIMESVLAFEKPDLVVFSGDQVRRGRRRCLVISLDCWSSPDAHFL